MCMSHAQEESVSWQALLSELPLFGRTLNLASSGEPVNQSFHIHKNFYVVYEY